MSDRARIALLEAACRACLFALSQLRWMLTNSRVDVALEALDAAGFR